jgi:hypothetical protein
LVPPATFFSNRRASHLVLVAIGGYVLSALLARAFRGSRGGTLAAAAPAELAAR